eukprot:jgi/Tetstr1/440778/TSEL_029086.t1
MPAPSNKLLQFIEGNTTRVSFVYLIMLHIGNDVAPWISGALDDSFLCRLVEELPLNAIGAFQKIFGKFCYDVELARCVNEVMKFHNGDGGYGMMKDFAEQTHQREFARLKEKYLRDHNLSKLPHCVSEAIMYCQAAMSNGAVAADAADADANAVEDVAPCCGCPPRMRFSACLASCVSRFLSFYWPLGLNLRYDVLQPICLACL